MHDFRSPRWLPGGNLQTLWPALWSRRHAGPAPVYRRERWDAPDGDFIDVDFQDAPTDARTGTPAPLLVLFHGLEGSSRSHYAEAFAAHAAALGLAFAVPHFRGCSGTLNLAPRAYHSGDFEEIGWILRRFAERQRAVLRAAGPDGAGRSAGPPQASEHTLGGPRGLGVPSVGVPILAAGVSLGGNALLRWAEEAGAAASQTVRAVAAVSAPLDLAAGGAAIGRGFNRQVYTRMFMQTMKPKALAKLAQHPGLFSRERLLAARDLHDFDDVFTAPLHGFAGVQDYWRRASAKPHLRAIRVPALVMNARNDPFVPATSLPGAHEVGAHVTLWQPPHGGHVGFAQGRPPGHVRTLPEAVIDWLRAHL